MDIAALVMNSGLVAKGVLVVLLLFSIGCWTIIVMKWSVLRRAERDSAKFLGAFKGSDSLFLAHEASRKYRHSPLTALFEEVYQRLTPLLKENPGIDSFRDDRRLSDFL